jgi:hypothetical protein
MELFDKAHYDSLDMSGKIAYKHKIRRSQGHKQYLTEHPVPRTPEQRAADLEFLMRKALAAINLTKA